MARELGIGDAVAVTATIIKLVGGRASVSLPGYSFPHSIAAEAGAKPRDQVELIGEVRRVDADDGRVTVSLPGGVVTLDIDHVQLMTKYRPPKRRTALRDIPD